MRIELSKPDRWAVLLDDMTTISNGERRSIMRAFERANQDGTPLDRTFVLGDEMIRLLVTAWNVCDRAGVPLPLPSEDVTVLDRMPAHDYDILAKRCTGRQDELWPKFDPDGAADPSSPTEPSGA